MIERDPATGFPIFRPDGAVLRAFMRDQTSRVKVIQGPQGSGTSSACCMHVFQRALAQPKQQDGRQRFRAHILRETYSKLEETTIPTWKDWFPPGTRPGEFGIFYETRPYRHEIRVGPLILDVTFVAMEDIRDAKSFFMSLETSLIWFNEVQFAQYEVFSEAVGRVSPPRYPAMKDGGCAWGGLIADTNAPPADHWLPIMRGDVAPPDWMTEEKRNALKKPDNWGFYMQPPGLVEQFEETTDGDGRKSRRMIGYKPNPDAENLKYLPANFYDEKIAGKTKSWIDANIMNRSSVVTDGNPVYPLFQREVHVSERPLVPIEGIPVVVGLDFGRQPAAMIGQCLRTDWFMQREFIGRDISAVQFAPALKAYLAQNYPGFTFIFWGDPAGATRGQANDVTPFDVFKQHGMIVRPAPNPQNQYSVRHEAVNAVLMRRSSSGRPSALLVDPRCVTFITGMCGGYFMRRLRVTGERYADEPEKNQYSHVCFSTGTPIETARGPVPIETLQVGDLVCTPIGLRRVKFTMARMANVSRYEFSSGQKLVCTADHPFFTHRGFVAIDAVEYTDNLATENLVWKLLFRLHRLDRMPNGRSSRFAECATTTVLMVISAIRAAAICIVGFGSRKTDQFQTAMSFTTRTATRRTTTQTISNACQRQTMKPCTWRASSAEHAHLETCSAQLSPPPNGDENTQNAPPRSPRKGRLDLSFTWRWLEKRLCAAITATASTRDSSTFERHADFAQRSAFSARAARVVTMTKTGLARYAKAFSSCIGMIIERPVRLIARQRCGRALVHNLEVEDAHSYYAAGLLVSNCEAGENAFLGGGEGKSVTMGAQPAGPARIRQGHKSMRRIVG